jgi:hypothetical protein
VITETFTKKDMPRIMAVIAGFFASCDDKQYTLEIKEKKKKRSLDSNSYFWVLCGRLAEKTKIPRTDIYRSYIREIGGNSDLLCIQDIAVEHFCKMWEVGHIGRFTDLLPSKLDGCTNVVVYYGSSDYDQPTMSRLIDMVVQDCKENGIETLTPAEIAAMYSAWRGDSDAER